MSGLTIGIYGDAGDQLMQSTVSGVIQYCTEKGGIQVRDFRMRKMLQNLEQDAPPWKGVVDGIVLGMGRDQYSAKQSADWILSGGVPAVNFGHDWFDPRIPSFHTDHDAVARCAAEHLRKCKCESFLYLGYEKSSGSSARGKAFADAISAFGGNVVCHATPIQMLGVFEDVLTIRKDEKLIELLRHMPKPLGIIGLNDFFAGGACALCSELGLGVPDTVRILGAGDTSYARLLDPPLSTIRTPRERIAYEMAQELHRILQGKPAPTRPTAVGGVYIIPRISTVGAIEPVGNIDDVRRYIDDHACVGVTVDQLVQIVGVSRRSFETWFKEQVGRSPRDEISRVRLEKAKQLLSRSDLSMARIATMVGFQESAAFSRFFKNESGCSPRTFRQKAAGGDGAEKPNGRRKTSKNRAQDLEFHI